MTKAPNLWKLDDLLEHVRSGPQCARPGSGYVPARPLGFYSLGSRLSKAWLVFTGRADALVWPQGQ